MESETAPKSSVLFGSVMVFVAFLAFGVVYGTCLYSFTVFAPSLAQAFNADAASVQLAFALLNVGTGILGIFGGRLLASVSTRLAMIIGLIILAIGFVGLSFSTSLTMVYVLYAVVVAGGSIIVAPLGASAIVTNWFVAARGRALTMATLGTSFGQLVLPVVAGMVIKAHDWQTAYQVFGAIVIATILPMLFIVDRPEKKGLIPFGADKVAHTPSSDWKPELPTNGQILGRSDFWIIAISYILCVVCYLAVVATIVPYARIQNVDPDLIPKLTVTMGLAAIAGKLGFAAFTDRIGLRNTFWIAVALNLSANVLLITMPDNTNMLFVAAGCVGASAGGILPVWPGLVAFRFGRHALPKVMGLMAPIVVSLQGFGAPFAAAMHFRPAFMVFVGMLVLSAILSIGLSKPAKTPPAPQPAAA
jgi:MFS family permease